MLLLYDAKLVSFIKTVVEFSLTAVLVCVGLLKDSAVSLVVHIVEVYKGKLVKLVGQIITLTSSF